MKHFLSLVSLAAGTCALVGRPRHENDAVANNALNLLPRHRGWKSRTRHWHYDDDDEEGTSTCTVTVTVTVTQPIGDFPSSDGPFFNATVPADNSTTPTSVDDQAPITLIDLSTLPSVPDATSEDAVPAPTPTDDQAPVTTPADVNTEDPVPAESSSSSGDASAPVENSAPFVTLIVLPTAAAANA